MLLAAVHLSVELTAVGNGSGRLAATARGALAASLAGVGRSGGSGASLGALGGLGDPLDEVLDLVGVDVAFVPWAPDTELDALCDLDVGIMPLHDDERSRGRCGYKALQYLACGVPVVASPVGGSAEILGAVPCGSYAADDAAWRRALGDLAGDPVRRAAAGAAGRAHVEAHYSIQANVEALVRVLDDAAGRRS